MSSLTSSCSKTFCRGTATVLYPFQAYQKHSAVSGISTRLCRHERVVPGVGRLLAPITCSAVVDRPPEFDLHSVDLGWPRGFSSRYALGDQLGKGSFGTVYLATDRVTGEEVAAKVIPKERKGTTREHILEKIQQEVSLGHLAMRLTFTLLQAALTLNSSCAFVRLTFCGECKAQMRHSGFCLCMRYSHAQNTSILTKQACEGCNKDIPVM